MGRRDGKAGGVTEMGYIVRGERERRGRGVGGLIQDIALCARHS